MLKITIRPFVFLLLLAGVALLTPRVHIATLPPKIEPGSLQTITAMLEDLRSQDVLLLKLDTLGGDVNEYLSFKKAAENTKGTLVCYVGYESDSAGAMIMQLCDTVYLSSNATVLFHMPRYFEPIITKEGLPGVVIHVLSSKSKNLSEVIMYLRAQSLMHELGVDKLLGHKQFKKMLDGQDIIINTDYLIKKNNKKFKRLL